MLKYLLTFILFLNTIHGFSQIQNVTPVSPEAATLKKFVDFPVDYSTGVPDITIPLLNIKSAGINLPISISYHASGFKINEKATWAGLGWQLNAEPEITRSTNGLADITPSNGIFNSSSKTYTASRDLQYLKRMVYLGQDEEPDAFYYKLAGSSGKFYYQKYEDNTYKAFSIPYVPIIIGNNTEYNTILDVDGSLYQFGGEGAYEQFGATGGGWGSLSSATWKCTKIISASKVDTISFSYSSDAELTETSFQERYEVYDSLYYSSNNVGYDGLVNGYQYLTQQYSAYPYQCSPRLHDIRVSGERGAYYIYKDESGLDKITKGTINILQTDAAPVSRITRVKINEIKFRSGRVQFLKIGSALNAILLYDPNNILLKKIQFYQSYWNTGSERRLDSVVIQDAQGKTIERYNFEYNNSSGREYIVKRSDPWGYPVDDKPYGMDYENSVKIQNIHVRFKTNSLFSKDMNIAIGSYSNPLADPVLTQAFMLRSIYYPTGGRAKFSYERNLYRENGILKTGGGLRIKKIEFFNGSSTGRSFERIYKYGENEDGTGFVKVKIDSVRSYRSEQNIIYYNPMFATSSGSYYMDYLGSSGQNYIMERKRTFFAKPLNPISSSPVVYSCVTEYQQDNGSLFGKTKNVYRYDYDSSTMVNIMNGPILMEFDDWRHGSLLSETNYAYTNGKYVWVRKREREYKDFTKESIYVGKVYPYNLVFRRNDLSGPQTVAANQLENIYYDHYNLNAGRKLPTVLKEYVRDVGDTTNIITTIANYYYDNINSIYPTREIAVNSNGDTLTTYTMRPVDYVSTDPVMDPLRIANRLDLEIEKVTLLKKQGENTSVIINGYLNTYNSWGDKVNEKHLETNIPYSSTSFKFSNSPNGILPFSNTTQYIYQPTTLYQLKKEYVYDNFGNLIESTTNGLLKNTILWGYKNLYPIAEAYNCSKGNISFINFEGEDNNSWSYSPLAVSLAGGSHTGKYAFNLSSATLSKSGLVYTQTFIVSYWTKNSSPFTINGTIGSPKLVRSTNGWNLYQHSLNPQSSITITGENYIDDIAIYPADAELKTYTYNVFGLLSSLTDAKGYTSFYEYDTAGRLVLIKDQNGQILKQYKYHYNNN